MLRILKPIIMTFVKTNAIKKLIVDLLRALAKTTDNTIDDQIVDYVSVHLWPEDK